MEGVTFGTKHSYDDFGLILTGTAISLPEPKLKMVELPGADGMIDLTEVLTDEVKYNNRTISFSFTAIDDVALWPELLSKIANYLHGRKMQIIYDADNNYYYEGRCAINEFKTDRSLAFLVIDCDVEPYKMTKDSVLNYWLWDPFRFTDGIVLTSTVTVSGTLEVSASNLKKIVSPTFTCSVPMTVTFEGETYKLPQGTSTIMEIRLKEGDNTLIFKGNGTVSIDYKGGSL